MSLLGSTDESCTTGICLAASRDGFTYEQVHDHPIITNLIAKMHRLISVWAGKRSGRRWVGPIVVLGPDAEIGPPAGNRRSGPARLNLS